MLNADFDYRVENSNFTISQDSVNPVSDKTYLYNYDRLRFRGDYTKDEFFATIIADGVNYYGVDYVNSSDFEFVKEQKSDAPFKTQSEHNPYGSGSIYAKFYRAYGGYEDDKNRVVAGLQNITMGVGRIWTPTNVFNPRNTYALEPDETFGVLGISYVRHISDTSDIMVVASQKEDSSFKYAGQYKVFLDVVELGLNGVSSDNTQMLGYEIEADFGDTGVEVRSEGSFIKTKIRTALNAQEDKEFFQGIVGADYAFVDGITMIVEGLYSSETFSYNEILENYDSEVKSNFLDSNFYGAVNLSYAFNIFLNASLVYIESFSNENSHFISPTLTYTFNDYNTFTLGAMIQESEAYYLKWNIAF